jgi:competence protein ComEC
MATISVLTRGNAVRLASIVGRPGQAELADANRGRFALWLPVWFGIGIGIGLYFTLPVEPAFWPSLGGFALFGLAALFLHRARGGPFFALLIPATVTAGFAAAQFRTDFVSAPVLEREIGPAAITARVLKVEPIGKGVRLTLDRILVQRRDFATPPDRIRLSVRSTKTQPLPGGLASALAILRPPPHRRCPAVSISPARHGSSGSTRLVFPSER